MAGECRRRKKGAPASGRWPASQVTERGALKLEWRIVDLAKLVGQGLRRSKTSRSFTRRPGPGIRRHLLHLFLSTRAQMGPWAHPWIARSSHGIWAGPRRIGLPMLLLTSLPAWNSSLLLPTGATGNAGLALLRNFRKSDAMTSADTSQRRRRRENSQIVEPPSLESAIRPIMDVAQPTMHQLHTFRPPGVLFS